MAAIDKLGIINIIDKHFDALNGEYSPYVIEGNSTVFSFFKKLYDILKDGSIFENNLLLKTYEETIKEILVKLEQIENRKIYQYNFANSSDINDIKNSFTEMLKYLWKYVDRHFPQTLTENEQKVGYYNKNFGYHIEKEIEIEHTEESYEQISNEELQAGPQEGEEYYVHPIASTEVEYNPVTELEPQAGVEYYTNPVVSTREDYSLTQDSEPQPGAEYYVRSIIETIEIYNLAEETEPKADETYYTHPINEREVYTEESEPQAGEEYYVHPIVSTEVEYNPVTEPQQGVEYYVHPTVEREVYNLVQDKSSVSLPYNEYYKHDENTYIPCTDEDFVNTLYVQVDVNTETVTPKTVGNFYIHRYNRYDQADEDDFEKTNIQFSETSDVIPKIDKINNGKYFVCYGDTLNNDDYFPVSLKNLIDDPDAQLIVNEYDSNVFDYYTTDENGDEILATIENGYILNPEPGVLTFVEGREYYIKKNFNPDTTYYESTYNLAFRTIESWVGAYYKKNPNLKSSYILMGSNEVNPSTENVIVEKGPYYMSHTSFIGKWWEHPTDDDFVLVDNLYTYKYLHCTNEYYYPGYSVFDDSENEIYYEIDKEQELLEELFATYNAKCNIDDEDSGPIKHVLYYVKDFNTGLFRKSKISDYNFDKYMFRHDVLLDGNYYELINGEYIQTQDTEPDLNKTYYYSSDNDTSYIKLKYDQTIVDNWDSVYTESSTFMRNWMTYMEKKYTLKPGIKYYYHEQKFRSSYLYNSYYSGKYYTNEKYGFTVDNQAYFYKKVEPESSLSFKEDIDYYTKEIVEELDTNNYITNKSSFEEGVDYFTKTVTKTYDNSSYVLAENLEEGIPYFTKTIVKEVVDDTSYVPAGDLQSFDDDIDYFTKTIAYTYDDSSYEPAGNLQSFDENTQYFNKIVTNIYDTSSYVPAENLQVFDDGVSYFTKSITYTYDDSSYESITDLQSFDENIDYFTKKITVVTETQTISTYESDDGTELKFNGYKEDIIIGGKLLPIYNENGKVEYDNDVYIKMLGVDKVYPEIIVRLSKNEEYKYYNLNDAILTIFKNDNYKKFSTNDADSKNVLIEYSFDNGFVVNDNNEYESPNGFIYELFLSALRSIVDSSRNYFMEKLKKYFYDGIVSRYREKKIEDKRTSLVIRDDGLNSNDMMVVPKVYEKLGGKGGSIGSITTLDFDKKTNFDSSEYIRMVFDDAYYNTKTNNIELYFDLSYMNGFIKSLSNYRGIDGFINNYAMRFDKDADIRQWLLINKKEIEEAILKSLLFAIEPCFWPDYTNDESWNKNFYVNNAAKLQKVYYYNNKTYSKEDELLKDLNLNETNKKFVEYSVIRKQRNISIDFDNDKFIILLKNEDRLTIDKELFDENDSYFERNTISNEEYNEKVADYFEKLNLEKLYLGSGYINIRKVPQKFKDNGVSELVDCEYVNKNVFNESEEFSSILDDREFIILHNVNTKVSNGNNVFYDTENNYSDIEFPYELEGSVQTIPIWKSAKLYKKKHCFELVCSNFMKKNNIEAIKQIRVMQPTNNKNRYLFNVRSIENRTTEERGILFDINFKELEDYKISYVLNNTLHIPNQSVLSTGINEDTLKLSSLPENEKFDYYSDSSLRITYGDEKFPSEEQYVFGDTMYIKSPSNIVEEEELLILAERSKEYKVFTSEYIMILEPGLETNKLNIADGEYINVQILDFLQVSPGAINVELPQLVYDNEGNGSVYVKTVEPEPLIFRGFYKKFELIDSSPSLLVERRNMINFNINKQNLTIKKELNKKITFKENLKFSKQMALRIFDESPKLELFENKWLKCKRLNISLECKVSNMGELQLEKIERVYLEFPEFSDKNTILEVNFLPEEAWLINSVIKLLPNNYTFRNDKNAVYIYDSNGNSVDTLYKNFYLDCDVPKQSEKNIEGEKIIDFEFRPSREYFNGTDRWMQLINNQPFVIPLIEGMDQELKKFEVIFQ